MTTLAQSTSIDLIGIHADGGLFAAIRRFAQTRRKRNEAAQADQQFWNAALADPRIMAEITRAKQQHPGEIRKARFMRTM